MHNLVANLANSDLAATTTVQKSTVQQQQQNSQPAFGPTGELSQLIRRLTGIEAKSEVFH